jgi:hypothetical protein
VVEVAKRAGVTHGPRFRIDTTVVETNVHYPTDSTLLQDGVRVLTRTMQRASAALGDLRGRVRDRLRSVTRRVLIIGYEARSPKTRDAMVTSYRKLMATTRAVLRDTATMVRRLGQRVRTARPTVQPLLQRAQNRLQAMRPLVQQVVGGEFQIAGISSGQHDGRFGGCPDHAAIGVWYSTRQCGCHRYELTLARAQPVSVLGSGVRPFSPACVRWPL